MENLRFKFRAWDNKKNIFVPQGEIIFSDYGDTRITVNPNCIEYIGDSCHDYPPTGRFIVMQYTGLKDKNNVEIFEGDIIKDSSNRLMIVEWDNRVGAARFIFRVINTIAHIKAGRLVNPHDWIVPDDNDIEVIGNIYEHSHLLDNN